METTENIARPEPSLAESAHRFLVEAEAEERRAEQERLAVIAAAMSVPERTRPEAVRLPDRVLVVRVEVDWAVEAG